MLEARRPTLPLVATVAIAGIVTLGWWAWTGGSPADTGAPAAVPAGSNLVLISIDTLRADRLPPYGYTRVATPALSRIAREGVVARAAYTPVPLTLPAHSTLMTGLLPPSHGVRDNSGFRLGPSIPTLATIFRERGYRTGAFVSAFVLDARWGLDRGFDAYHDEFTVAVEDLAGMAAIQRPGAETWGAARGWLDAEPGRPFFLWLHLFDPHTPYSAPEPFGSQYANSPYDGEIAYVDSVVSDVVATLEKTGRLERTAIAIVSDHGEGLGDHGEDEHGLMSYDSTLRVPWLMRLPERRFAGSVIDTPSSLADVAPTLLELFGFSAPSRLDGTSRASAVTDGSGRTAEDVVYAETYYPRFHFGWSELITVRQGPFKYIRAPRPELYDLDADPSESRNIVAERPDVAGRLHRILDRIVRDPGQTGAAAPPMDSDAERRLQALGYIASGPTSTPVDGATLADPKDKAPVYRTLMRARDMLANARTADAGLATLQELMRREPDLAPAHHAIRTFLLARGKTRQAIDTFSAALAHRPGDPLLLLELAHVRRAAGQAPEALATLEQILAAEPRHTQALQLAGDIALDGNDVTRALAYFSRALEVTPDADDVAMKLAAAQVRLGRVHEAEALLARTFARHPNAAGAHYLQALIAEQRGELARAEAEYRQEIAQQPWDYRARFNLALLLGGRGAFGEQAALLDSIPPLAPGFAEVHFYRAKAYLDMGTPDRRWDAFDAARTGLRLAPMAQSAPLGHYVLADLYALEGRHADAAREVAAGRALEARRSPGVSR